MDKFFGKLPTYLENQRNEILSIVTCLGDYRKILYNIVKDKKNLIFPIELFISPVDLIKNFLNIIKLQFKVNQTIYFDHIDLTQFINDYFLINKANEISLNHVLEYDSIKGLLKYFSIKSFIATYENIPWEPMCFLALKETSPETMSIGYQHSNVSDFDTNYFLSGYELSKRPLPDRIYTVGPITKNIIEKNSGGQYPYIESTCALRYKYLHYGIKNFRNNNKKILIALEGIRDVYHLVNYVLDELSQNNNFELIIRPHPILPISKLKKYIEIDYSKLNNISISSGDPIIKDLEQVSAVIYRESAVALEAIAFGLPVICFQSDPVISYDPLFELDDFKWTVDESVKLEPLLNQIIEMDDFSFNNKKEKARLYIQDYFKTCTDDKMSMFTNV